MLLLILSIICLAIALSQIITNMYNICFIFHIPVRHRDTGLITSCIRCCKAYPFINWHVRLACWILRRYHINLTFDKMIGWKTTGDFSFSDVTVYCRDENENLLHYSVQKVLTIKNDKLDNP